jgi:hypothetical protein
MRLVLKVAALSAPYFNYMDLWDLWYFFTYIFDNNFVLSTGLINANVSKLCTETLHDHVRLIDHYFQNFLSHSGNNILVQSFHFLENVVLGDLTIL